MNIFMQLSERILIWSTLSSAAEVVERLVLHFFILNKDVLQHLLLEQRSTIISTF